MPDIPSETGEELSGAFAIEKAVSSRTVSSDLFQVLP